MELLFRFCAYVMLGFTLEVVFVAITKILDGEIGKNDKKLEGHTYLWMVPTYGLGALFVFEPIISVIAEWSVVYRFLTWAIIISSIEILSGFIYDKILGFCPWDYSKAPDKIFNRGYGRWSFVPLWGLFGFVVEQYYYLLTRLGSCI